MGAPVSLAAAMSFRNLRLFALKPRAAHQRFAFQCMAVALFLVALVAMGITGSRAWNVQAAPGQPGILPTKPANPTNFPTIEALLRQSPHDTVVLLKHVEHGDHASRSPKAQQRFDSFVKFMEFVDDKDVRVAVLAQLQPGASSIDPDYVLPDEINAVFKNVTPRYMALTGGKDGVAYLTRKANGRTMLETEFPGVRNIVMVSSGMDWDLHVPVFEALWNRITVYRNVNLDPLIDETQDRTFLMRYVDRLDAPRHFETAAPLELPTVMALDPHLHYVPIGNIPGVLATLPNADYKGSFAPNGVPYPHAFTPGTKPRAGLGAFAETQQFDAQIRLSLTEMSYFVDDQEYAGNPHRTALVKVPQATVKAYADHTAGMSITQMRQAVVDLGVAQASGGVPLPPRVARQALKSGAVELTVTGHGGLDGSGYEVGDLAPTQLAALIVAHPDLAVGTTLAGGDAPRIKHLRMLACGVRCRSDYVAGTGGDQTKDEVEYARELVRQLHNEGVSIDRITVHNASVVPYALNGPGAVGTWFRLQDVDAGVRGWAYESNVLSTSMAYDASTDKFVEDPDFNLDSVAIKHTRALPVALHTDVPHASKPGGQVPAWSDANVGTAIASPGYARATTSAAVIDVAPAPDVQPRLEAPSRVNGVAWAAMRPAVGVSGTIVTMADLNAIAAGSRPDAGKVVVVDTDPSSLEGVRRAVHLAGESTDMIDWIAKLRANALDTAGTTLVDMWKSIATNRSDVEADLFRDTRVVEHFNAFKARALAGDYSFHGADLTTRDGGAVVNVHLGQEPVLLLWLPSDEMFLARNALLGATATRGETLYQLRLNLALLMGPDTTLWQQQGLAKVTWKGEQAFRDHFQLPGADKASNAASTDQGAVTAESRDEALVDDLDKELEHAAANVGDRDRVQDAMRDREEGRLHDWWTRARETLGSVASWIRGRFAALMQALGLWEGPAVQTPAEAVEMQRRDAATLRIDAQQLGTELVQTSHAVLVANAIDPHAYVPVFHSVRELDPAPCVQSGCTTRTAEPEYEIRWLHETTGEERIVRTRDPVFAKVRDFLDTHVVQANADAAGGHVSSMNAAFALMGFAQILQSKRQLEQPDGLSANLATGLQVQMYMGEAQAVLGVTGDALKLVQLAREGMREAAQVVATVGQAARLELRLLQSLTTLVETGNTALSAAMVGVDIYNLANATTDTQRTVAGARLGIDSTGAALTAGAIVAEAAGAATASAVMGSLAVPLAGLGIGIAGLVEAFMAVAEDVDASAAKFDKFADLYPRIPWYWAEEYLPDVDPTHAVDKRQVYTWESTSQMLQPVHGIAFDKVDLRTRNGQGERMAHFAQSYVDRADPSKQGSQAICCSRPTLTGGNVPSPDPHAAPIPILGSRTGIFEERSLPLKTTDVVTTLVAPATPASHFHGYAYQNLPFANSRHLLEAGFMGYEVLRRLESTDWNAGFFLFDFDLNAIETILRTIREDWRPTTVDLLLDDAVQTIAWPEFVIPKNTTWTPAQQQAYRASTRQMLGNMHYRLSPSGRVAPYLLALQDGYGTIELQAASAGKATTWMLDARHLANGDAITVAVGARAGGPGQHGVLRISGNEIRAAGVSGTTPVAGEGTAEVYVVLAHGVWHVDFAKGELVSKDVLAATDLVHDQRVQEALKRHGFSWRSDGFIEIATRGDAPTDRFPLFGGNVKRYYQSVRDEALAYAIESRYPKATLVFGDAHEALFHDPDSGLLLRVPRGSLLPTRAYRIGQDSKDIPHTIKRVDRLDGDSFFVLVEYGRKRPAYWEVDVNTPEVNGGMTIAYRVGADALQLVALMNHAHLSAYLEAFGRVVPPGVPYGDFMSWLGTVATVDYATTSPIPTGDLTAVVPVPAEWVSLSGMVNVPAGDVLRQYWIRASDGNLLQPVFIAPSATCRVGGGAVDGSINGLGVRDAVPSAGCTIAHPGDAVMLDTFTTAGGGPANTWRHFYSPSLGATFRARAYDFEGTTAVVYPRTELVAVGKSGAAPEGEDIDGLAWRFHADGTRQLIGVGAPWVGARPASFVTDLTTLVDAQPSNLPALSPLPVTGLKDQDGTAIQAWYLADSRRWVLARAGMRLIDDGAQPPYRATVQDAAKALFTSATLPAPSFAKLFDGLTLRGKVQLDALNALASLGTPVALTSRRDAQCQGTVALYGEGTAMCLSATGKPRVLEMAWCPAQPTPVRPAGTEADYVQLTCPTPGTDTRARSGWLAPSGVRIAAPKPDALANAADYRLLGFNAQVTEAYFFHPGHEILYVTNWSGDLKRRHWVADANVVGETLFVQQARNGLAAAQMPRIDGLTTLALASTSHYTTEYGIDAATWLHYARIVVDMGAAPIGPHRQHAMQLFFSEASKLVVQGWPGGWRVYDPDMGKQIELRGTGGNKTVYFGDTGTSLDLSDVRPLSFLELPKTGFTPPAAEVPFTDRIDVDGDNIADLSWVVHEGGHGRLRWMSRRADGSVSGVETRSDVQVPWTTKPERYRLTTRAGTALYCAWVETATLAVGRTGVNCYAIDREGVRAFGHQPAAGGPPPPPAAFDAAIDATANAARYLQLEAMPLGELVFFDGTDFQCVRDGAANACLRADSAGAAKPGQSFLACPATTPNSDAPAWCQTARSRQVQSTVVGPWRSDASILNGGYWMRLNQGLVECLAFDGRACVAKTSVVPDFAKAIPLTCGAMMRIAYGFQFAWCQSLRAPRGDSSATSPPVSGLVPMVANLRIDGTLRVGNTLHARYDFAHAGGAGEGASQYQWSLIDAITNKATPINGAKQRTYTLTPKDQGAYRVRFTIERLVASTGDIAPGAYAVTTQDAVINGRPPEARNLRIEAATIQGRALDAPPSPGQTLKAVHDPHDPDGDVFDGSTTHQWCEYAPDSDTALGCTAWSTGDTHAVPVSAQGKRIAVKVIPRTTTGMPNVGAEVTSAKTAVVQGMAPEARNLRIVGEAKSGVPLKAVFDAFDADNDTFGGTSYQWCEYPTNSDTAIGCTGWMTSDTWTPGAYHVGKRLAVKVIPRTTTGSPNVGVETLSAKTVAVTSDTAPEARNVRIESTKLRAGYPLTAIFDPYDAENDPFGGTTYQWCRYPAASNTPEWCSAWSTSNMWILDTPDVDKRMAVKVIPRTTRGTKNVGAEATSAETSVIAKLGSKPVAVALGIEGEAALGKTLKANFHVSDNEGDRVGDHTYQWCAFALGSDKAIDCTYPSSSALHVVRLIDVGKQLRGFIVPRTPDDFPRLGETVRTEKTQVVQANSGPRVYANYTLLPIPDTGEWVESTIDVPDNGTFNDFRLRVKIAHPWTSDLQVFLVSPQGVSHLVQQWKSGKDVDQEFRISLQTTQQRGLWKLRIQDAIRSDVGTLKSWSVSFESTQ